MTGNGIAQSNQDLAERLRSRSKFHPLGGVDRKLMIGAAELLEHPYTVAQAEYDTAVFRDNLEASVVEDWFSDRGVKLLPWQRTKIGLETG